MKTIPLPVLVEALDVLRLLKSHDAACTHTNGEEYVCVIKALSVFDFWMARMIEDEKVEVTA